MKNWLEIRRAIPEDEDEDADDDGDGDYDAFSDYAAGLYTGRQRGAAVAFGLMGMAEAIRERLFEEAWGESCASSYCTCAVRHGHFSHCQTNA